MATTTKPSVLLIDDNEATCTLVTAILQRDFDVESAGDGLDAIERMRAGRYDAVLLDLRMPGHDGFSVLDFLKANRPDMLPRVLIVTALLSRPETARAKSYGVRGIVAKPFEVDDLFEAVRRCASGDGSGGTGGSTALFAAPVILLIADLLTNRLPF